MTLQERYVNTSEALQEGETRIVLSDDAYAITEYIEKLINIIDLARRK